MALAVIDSFRGDHYFLSNFYLAPVPFRGAVFPSSEHAFMAAKTESVVEFQAILAARTPGEAKALGRKVSLVPNWDTIRYGVMYDVLLSKFANNPGLRDALLATRGTLLVEGNDWHDQTWGSCTCSRHEGTPGDNALGVILMALRLRLGVAQPRSA